ncbi:DUF4189 domain-containing protein [Arthrobacter sp. Marseille-P9274]|uniref:DUF4189 domain-containing protein n=1 Tax=Arthrobacter sp. Marseille-P9274 TaxID=2866572 RepID=UPI0021C8EAC9|nr:DUF4189 domain-containing protein [Arthrobacter sp. Marseille-P9274]
MKSAHGKRPRVLVLLVVMLTALFTTGALTASAAPDALQTESGAVQADRWIAYALSPSALNGSHGYYSGTDTARLIRTTIDHCNKNKSQGAYDCEYFGLGKNEYLAVAVSWSNGPRAWRTNPTKSVASKEALNLCNNTYGGGGECYILFLGHSSDY